MTDRRHRAASARPISLLVALLAACASHAPSHESDTLRVATWNIWHGGREDGADVGPRKVAEVLRQSRADVIALQETYGSGEQLAQALGCHFLARGTNVSLLSRHAVIEDVSVFEPFKCVGALIELPGARRVAVYSLWLPYDAEIWAKGTRPLDDRDAMLAACASSARDLTTIRDAIDARLAGPAYAGVPIVLAGDFNSMSHLDYAEVARDQYGVVVEWPTSRVLTDAGYCDAYRACHPHVDRSADRTWSPRFAEQEQDRIDFVYVRGDIRPLAASRIDTHDQGFPSDHAAVVTTLRLTPKPPPAPLRAVSYNIRHGRGMDDKVDLARTAATLRRLAPDVVGLQEVDQRVNRSGRENQATRLAELVAGDGAPYHAAFGAFMDYGGGRYGMGLLSRYPIARAWSVPLPVGNEPRVALAAELQLPDGTRITAVNVHLDWVDDDGFRFAQAQALMQFVASLRTPWLLLGDFNDTPESRTLGLVRQHAREVDKVLADGAAASGRARLTFSSTKPEKEIDYLFVGAPAGASGSWQVLRGVTVHEEPEASDHRPLAATIRWLPEAPRN